MARPKKKVEFEIDFKFPMRPRELLYKEDGTEKYDLPTIFSFFDAHPNASEYTRDFVESVKTYFTKNGQLSSNQHWTLYNMAGDICPDWDDLNARFFVWYDSRADMQAMYKDCAPHIWWFYDRYGQHHNPEHAVAQGWTDRPADWKMFKAVADSGEAHRYRELKREIIYDISDQVMLRDPFKGSYRYDPCYNKGLTSSEDRIGMVVEHKEEITRRSRGGKGSRLINVLWLQTGDTIAVPERTIKKYRAPKE